MKATGADLYLLNELLESVDNSTNIEEVEKSIKLIDQLIDVDSSICTAIQASKKGIKTSSAMVRFPQKWVNRYIKKGYAFLDPVAQIAISEPGCVHDWSDAFNKRPAPRAFLNESREFQLIDGAIMGCQTEDFLTQFSVVANSQTKIERQRLNGLLRIVTPRLHNAMIRAAQNPLSQREIEVLWLICQGCTNRDVSQNLNPPVSYDTVLQYVKNIKRKLGARNIQHAIFIAAKSGFVK